MQLFTCPTCGVVVFFENRHCVHCGSDIAYDPETGVFLRLDADPNASSAGAIRPCGNRVPYDVCNWAIPSSDECELCPACRLNTIIPDLAEPAGQEAWRRLETGKRRLLHTLRSLGLSWEPRGPDSPDGLAFAFLRDGTAGQKVTTGHADGLITINIAEANDASRETFRAELGEPYRTVLGHFRHESGHYYWDRLIRDGNRITAFRQLFGDEQPAYSDALQRYYREGAAADWATRHLSAYASSHPWEDWAETWAHYLHMVDGVETASVHGLTLNPPGPGGKPPPPVPPVSRADVCTFDDMVTTWMSVTVTLNSFNRGMGFSDVYPFAFSEPVIAKLRFIHQVIIDQRATPKKS